MARYKTRQNDFWLGKEVGINDLFWKDQLDDKWPKRLAKIIKKEKATVLTFSIGFFTPEQIKFSLISELKELNLRGLSINSTKFKDILFLNDFKNIEYLSLNTPFSIAPDFSNFEKLKFLNIQWRTKARPCFKLKNLEYLQIRKYPDEDFTSISHMRKLSRLNIRGGKLTSLAGVGDMPSLEILDVFNCRKLVSLNDIHKAVNLKRTIITRCKQITPNMPFANLVEFNDLY